MVAKGFVPHFLSGDIFRFTSGFSSLYWSRRRNTLSTSFRCPCGHILYRSHRGESLLAWAAVVKNLLVSFLERQRLERLKIFVGVESYHYANISSSNVTYTEKEITLWKTSYGHWVDVSLGDPVLGRTTATGKVKIDPERLVRRLTNTRTVYTSWKCNASRSMTDIAVYKHEPLYNGHLRERREWPL